MTDILREVEDKDQRNLVETHVFITQYKEKFDIRTTMLVRISTSLLRVRANNCSRNSLYVKRGFYPQQSM